MFSIARGGTHNEKRWLWKGLVDINPWTCMSHRIFPFPIAETISLEVCLRGCVFSSPGVIRYTTTTIAHVRTPSAYGLAGETALLRASCRLSFFCVSPFFCLARCGMYQVCAPGAQGIHRRRETKPCGRLDVPLLAPLVILPGAIAITFCSYCRNRFTLCVFLYVQA